jgi:hypothetical protein
MRKVMFFRFGGKEVHLPRLIGAFILFAALLMFVKSSADMFNGWDAMKTSEDCIKGIDTSLPQQLQQEQFRDCADTLYFNTSIYLTEGQASPTSRQFWGALLEPIASVLFWLAVLFLGWMLYRTGEIVVPIEEIVREIPEETPVRTAVTRKAASKKAKKK